MSQQDNPYLPPAETSTGTDIEPIVEQPPPPVSFSGHHCTSDCWLWFQPGNFLTYVFRFGTQFWIPLTIATIGIGLSFAQIIQGGRIWPFFYYPLSLLVMPLWYWAWGWTAAYQRSRRLSKRKYYRDSPKFAGFLDAQGVFASEREKTMWAQWSEFEPPSCFPNRIELQFKRFQNQWILPSRFFASPQQYHDARTLVYQAYYSDPDYQPQLSDVQGLPYASDASLDSQQIEEARKYDSQNWPFEMGEQRIEFVYKPQAEKVGTLAILRTWGVHWILRTGPILLSLPIWLWVDYRYYRDWDFITINWLDNACYLIALTLTLFWYLRQMRGEYKQSSQGSVEPIRMVASETGFCMAHEKYFFWSTWKRSLQVISTPDVIGFNDLESSDDAKIELQRRFLDPGTASRLEELLNRVVGSFQSHQMTTENHDEPA